MMHVYLPSESQRKLMELSRQALEDFVRGMEREREQIDDPYLQSREYGAFVSLHKKEELRGCIGNCAPKARLFETVTEMTQAAASRDPRVKPVAKKELAEIRIDITVLSPLELLEEPLTLEIGKHGLYIASGGKRGVLLPQVATQYGWDIKTFLEQTCLKAGLRKNAWIESDAQVSGFTALIIEEQP
jgi:AmmeMemoRadiSam system protein A